MASTDTDSLEQAAAICHVWECDPSTVLKLAPNDTTAQLTSDLSKLRADNVFVIAAPPSEALHMMQAFFDANMWGENYAFIFTSTSLDPDLDYFTNEQLYDAMTGALMLQLSPGCTLFRQLRFAADYAAMFGVEPITAAYVYDAVRVLVCRSSLCCAGYAYLEELSCLLERSSISFLLCFPLLSVPHICMFSGASGTYNFLIPPYEYSTPSSSSSAPPSSSSSSSFVNEAAAVIAIDPAERQPPSGYAFFNVADLQLVQVKRHTHPQYTHTRTQMPV